MGFSPIPQKSNPWLYLPDGWNSAWQAAKSASKTTPATIAVLGDSVAQGTGSSDFWLTSWWAKVRSSIVSRYGLYGDFYNLEESAAWIVTNEGSTYAGTPPWVLSTTNLTWRTAGMPMQPNWTATAPNPMATFTSQYACTELDLIYGSTWTGNGSSFTYTVDGGSTQTVNITTQSGLPQRAKVTGLASTTHTLAITTQSATNAATIHGVATIAASGGIGFAKHAAHGRTMGDFFPNSSYAGNIDKIGVIGGNTVGSTATFGFPYQPHLTIIALGLNDIALCLSSTGGTYCPPDLYARALERIVQGVRRGRSNASVLILSYCLPDGLSTDSPLVWTNQASWRLYLASAQRVAETFNCAHLNIHAKWGETPVGQGFMNNTNDVHPNSTGHADIATSLLGVV